MENCIFCRIAGGEIPAKKVVESDRCVAFHDLSPQAPVHVLVIPRQHLARLSEAQKEERDLLGDMMLCAAEVARTLNIGSEFRIVVNNGASAGQSVFHLHLHVLGGRNFAWPPG